MPWGSDPIATPAPSGGGWGKDPLVNAPSSAAPQSAGSGWGSWLTSPQFMNESYAQEAKDVGLSTADYLTLNQLKHLAPASVGNAISQAHQNLGLADYGVGAAAYALGPGKILKPLAAGLGGGIATEGALAGGISATDPLHPSIADTATGAGAGLALGYGAGKLGSAAETIGGSLGNKLGSTAGQVDPAFATQFTKQNRDFAYDALKNYAFNPNDMLAAHSSVTLTPGMAADVTPGMQSMLARQRAAIQNGGNTLNDLDDYVKNLKSASGNPNASNGDKLLAGQTASALEGMAGNASPLTGQPPGQAMAALTNARNLHQQYAMAKVLQEQGLDLSELGSVSGPDIIKQMQYYAPGSPERQALANYYKTVSGDSSGLLYPLTHIGAEGAEALAAASGAGGPMTMGVGALAHLAKLPIKAGMNAYKRAKAGQGIQSLYPAATGLSGAPSNAPMSVGDAIRGLTFSQGSQYGY